MLDAFGEDLGCGYDIGCKFKTTLNNSPLGPRARELRHRCLVGSFHGHAHGRLCQLDHLATYILGLGLEDLEGCERAFSKSNSLASCVRYASIFHRKQAIVTYFEHNDNFEVYQNLCKLVRIYFNLACTLIFFEQRLSYSITTGRLWKSSTPALPLWQVPCAISISRARTSLQNGCWRRRPISKG